MKPLRCFTCGKVLLWNKYRHKLDEHKQNSAQALNAMSVKRHCCRRMYITSLDASEQQIGLKQTAMEVKERVISVQQHEKKAQETYRSWFT